MIKSILLKAPLIFAISIILISCDQNKNVLFSNPHENRILHSPSIDVDGNILFASSILTNQGYWVDSTFWYLLNSHTHEYQLLPFTADHAHLSYGGEYVVYSDYDLYMYSIQDGSMWKVETTRDTSIYETLETFVAPLISIDGRTIYTRSTLYEFYFEDVAVFTRNAHESFSMHPISNEYLLATDEAHFTPDGGYLVTCGTAYGAESPTGVSLFDLKSSEIKFHLDTLFGESCKYDSENDVLQILDLYWYEKSDPEFVHIYKTYDIIRYTSTHIDTLDMPGANRFLFNYFYPLIAFFAGDSIFVYDTERLSTRKVGVLENFSWQADYFPKSVWVPQSMDLIVTTDKNVLIIDVE